MAAKLQTQSVARSSYVNFLQKAAECRRAAARSLAREDWNAATICAIHGSISACDALCAYALGLRHSGRHHDDAASLLLSIKPSDDRFKANATRLRRIIDIKNMAEYEERLVFRKEAEKAFSHCERFVDFVLSELPQRDNP